MIDDRQVTWLKGKTLIFGLIQIVISLFHENMEK